MNEATGETNLLNGKFLISLDLDFPSLFECLLPDKGDLENIIVEYRVFTYNFTDHLIHLGEDLVIVQRAGRHGVQERLLQE